MKISLWKLISSAFFTIVLLVVYAAALAGATFLEKRVWHVDGQDLGLLFTFVYIMAILDGCQFYRDSNPFPSVPLA